MQGECIVDVTCKDCGNSWEETLSIAKNLDNDARIKILQYILSRRAIQCSRCANHELEHMTFNPRSETEEQS